MQPRAAGGGPAAPLLDLAKGHPDPALLPREILAEACDAAGAAFRGGGAPGLAYGSGPKGSTRFLQQLASFLGRQCPGECPAREDGLMLTNGVSHGLELACSVFARPGDAVLVEAPTYYYAASIFESHDLEVVPVPTDESGLLVEQAEAVLDARPPGSRPVRLLYTIPVNHNPTGATLPPERRRGLVALARRRGLLVLADEVYHMLDWHPPGERPHRLVSFDAAYTGELEDDPAGGGGNSVPEPTVISVSSFTKILAPGLRTGWIEAAPALVDRIAARGYLRSGGCVTTFTTEAILCQVLESQAADHVLARLVEEYSSRARRLAAALSAAGLPALVEPEGGYFVWVALPGDLDAEVLLEWTREKVGLSFMPGARCFVSSSPSSRGSARFCFALQPADKLEEGVRLLAQAIRDLESAAS